LLKQGLFSGYKEAARWISANAKSSVNVPKPSTAEMIGLVKKAGGRAFMAHPGYYIYEGGLNLDKMIAELQPLGLDGLETEFPYLGTGPTFQSRESVKEIIQSFNRTAREYGLAVSRGSDAHTVPQMTAFNQ
jgi:predicted metal-dependent phosphoesterase TrpH